jgi:hypothetical protein
MAGGAVIAAAAAAHAKRLQTIIDAFRLEGATAPDRALAVEALGLERNAALAELIEEGVLLPAPKAGTWYLSESAYIARRDSRGARGLRMRLFVAALAAIAVVAAALILYSSRN